MADDIVVDKEVFYSRLSNFIKAWKDDKRTDELFQGVGSIVLCVGKASEGTYTKATAFQVRAALPSKRLLLTLFAAMVAWLRVSVNPHHYHTRWNSLCHYEEEGYARNTFQLRLIR